jgi:hypothetical protein
MSLPVKNACASHPSATSDDWQRSAGASGNVEVPIWVGRHSFSCPNVSLTGNSRLDAERTGEETLGSVVGKRAAN